MPMTEDDKLAHRLTTVWQQWENGPSPTDGSVWSCLDTGSNATGRYRRLMLPRQRNGYLRICLHRGGERVRFAVHRIILSVFVGECPDGQQACHNNGINDDNRLSNLRWDTPKGNASDRVRHGTHIEGDSHPHAKLTAADVVAIRARYAAGGVTLRRLAAEYGVQPANIGHVIAGRAWTHLPLVECYTSTAGERNGAAKLDNAKVAEIRQLYESGGWTQAALASRFGAAHQTISRVCRGELWKHTEDK